MLHKLYVIRMCCNTESLAVGAVTRSTSFYGSTELEEHAKRSQIEKLLSCSIYKPHNLKLAFTEKSLADPDLL